MENSKSSYEAAFQKLGKLGGESFLNQMIQIFLKDVPQRIDKIETALKNEQYETIEHMVHTIKSSAANLGANELASVAQSMEKLCSVKNRLELDHRVKILKKTAETTFSDLSSLK